LCGGHAKSWSVSTAKHIAAWARILTAVSTAKNAGYRPVGRIDTHTHRHTDRHPDRHTDRQTDRHTAGSL